MSSEALERAQNTIDKQRQRRTDVEADEIREFLSLISSAFWYDEARERYISTGDDDAYTTMKQTKAAVYASAYGLVRQHD
jgi:hypothetical protein